MAVLLLVLAPLAALLPLVAALRRGRAAADAWMVAATAGTFAGTLALAPAVVRSGRVEVEVHALLGQLRFALDGVGLVFALVASFVWLASTVYAGAYLRHDRRVARYHVASLVALSAMLGVLAAADLITLYLFFEWLGLIGYLFVVQVGGREAERAGLKYLVLTLLGGFALLAGVLLAHALGGTTVDAALPAPAGTAGLRATAAALLLVGFGVKAGVLGLHIWLPDAHTAAPAPASALLSGVIIKAGAYGVLRTLGWLYGDAAELPTWALAQGETLALVVLWLGVATALVGAAMALWQNHAKRLLAYSSVSQMGFVLIGLGAARALGPDGASGWAGALAHVANHALYKGLLFLALGAVIHACGVGDVRRLGGLWRRMPWTFAAVLIATAGIVGLPGSNGFASKSVIHHAIEHAAHHLADAGHGPAGLVTAERLFTLATVGTAAALAKLVIMTFLGRPRGATPRPATVAPWPMRAGMAGLAGAVLATSVWPHALAPVIAAGLREHGLPSAEVAAWLTAPRGQPRDVLVALGALAAGVAVHAVARRLRLYDHPPPAWASLDRIAVGAVVGGLAAARWAARQQEAWRTAMHDLAERERGAVATVHERSERRAAARARGAGSWRVLPSAVIAAIERVRAAGDRALVAIARLGRWLDRRLDRSHWLHERPTARVEDEGSRAAAAVARAVQDASSAERDRMVRAARWEIQRRSRDIGLAVGIVFLVWLLLLASLIAGAG